MADSLVNQHRPALLLMGRLLKPAHLLLPRALLLLVSLRLWLDRPSHSRLLLVPRRQLISTLLHLRKLAPALRWQISLRELPPPITPLPLAPLLRTDTPRHLLHSSPARVLPLGDLCCPRHPAVAFPLLPTHTVNSRSRQLLLTEQTPTPQPTTSARPRAHLLLPQALLLDRHPWADLALLRALHPRLLPPGPPLHLRPRASTLLVTDLTSPPVLNVLSRS